MPGSPAERLQRDQLLQLLAGLDEAGLGELAAVGGGLGHRVLAGDAQREVRPPEHARPLVLLADRDRRDVRALQLLDVAQEVVPGRGRVGDPGLLEELLVVPDPHEAEVVGDPVLLAVDLVETHAGGIEGVDPRLGGLGDVLDEPGVGLLLERAAAPRLEEVRRLAGLHVRRELGLERLVLEDRDLDLDVGMSRHVLVGGVLPDRLQRIVVGDVSPVDRDGLVRARLGGTGAAAGLLVVAASTSGDDQCCDRE
jgi:hypothetical protein